MGTKVDELIKLSLKRPVRIHVSGKKNGDSMDASGVEVANRLEQEFVRVRTGNEGRSQGARGVLDCVRREGTGGLGAGRRGG